ncbi:MAG: 2-oxo-4-hydroxy-4-carboxy-5-ureidoimidazoline decarboxylase [Saccharopolyspora sp.]|uniref:2-oxo-4-hydroxy-4-carboxy-5-ureidoimidazoline decarboxylase n=1 Tax=Saccharopolyspora TaxID=1835 RepID=UPI001909FEE0|nr:MULTISPECIES: 2-oxo-4-hydroxy-4-carboxy-5-ureidoimidazoline decarboxylase [unclassified Saccharopolyspora]MBK0865820.1 2-oxo-4-hydroxy-4-carboxy-5-ureidoimidazoline decarboxylase [Saccharopolyspora sp. HNM0986]MBQ6642049.1 2-oxo-4-hydroxy-4-carboxy-5-ureidoimidazoline decarboxylase [Saccharopolyspora sp.]
MSAPDRFNTADRPALLAELRACLDVPRWAAVVADARPYDSSRELRDRADQAARDLTDDEVHAALSAHPRIGERPSGQGAEAAHSKSEQSGVDFRDAELASALRTANAEYEDRFGHVYLVCASGRSGAELLEVLRSRLHNDPRTELGVVADELRKIALLRLEKVLE